MIWEVPFVSWILLASLMNSFRLTSLNQAWWEGPRLKGTRVQRVARTPQAQRIARRELALLSPRSS